MKKFSSSEIAAIKEVNSSWVDDNGEFTDEFWQYIHEPSVKKFPVKIIIEYNDGTTVTIDKRHEVYQHEELHLYMNNSDESFNRVECIPDDKGVCDQYVVCTDERSWQKYFRDGEWFGDISELINKDPELHYWYTKELKDEFGIK